jgi:hypothetical protein
LHQRVAPTVGAEKVAELHGIDSEGGVESVLGDGDVDAIEVVDQNAEAEERCDYPAATRHALICVGGWRRQLWRAEVHGAEIVNEGTARVEYLVARCGAGRALQVAETSYAFKTMPARLRFQR